MPLRKKSFGCQCRDMEDVAERPISVSRWCPWSKQPRVDRCYPGEITLCLRPFSLIPDGCLYWAFEKCQVIFSVHCETLCEGIPYSTPSESQKMVAITFPAENVVFTFLGFGNPGWCHCIEEHLLLGVNNEPMSRLLLSKKSPLPAHTANTMTAPIAAVYSCVFVH
jgi:hypothetical protein